MLKRIINRIKRRDTLYKVTQQANLYVIKEELTMKERIIKWAASYILKYGFDFLMSFIEYLKEDIEQDGFQKEDIAESAKKAFKKAFNL